MPEPEPILLPDDSSPAATAPYPVQPAILPAAHQGDGRWRHTREGTGGWRRQHSRHC